MSKRRAEPGAGPTERLRISLRAGRHVRLRAELRATPAGLASVAGLVSTMLAAGTLLTVAAMATARRPATPALLPPLRR